jgi:hypothetical protein
MEATEEAIGNARDLVERELPAVEPAGDVALDDSQRGLHRSADVRVPAAELRHVAVAMLGEEPQQLELGIDPRLEPPEAFEDQLLVEHDRAVGLFAHDSTHVDEAAPEPDEAFERSELDRAFARTLRRAASNQLGDFARERRVGEGVVHSPPVQ